MAEVEEELAKRLSAGEEVVLATVIRVEGDPPSRPGAKLLLGRGAPLAGTLGCSEFDSAALRGSEAALKAAVPDIQTYRHELGTVEVYLEPHSARPLLLLAGATPVAEEVLLLAARAGFRTALLETREERRQGREGQQQVLLQSVAELSGLPSGELYAVLTDHDSEDVVPALQELLRRDPAPRFIGIMGSRRHTAPHRDALRRLGLAEAAIASVRSPVGLAVGARSVFEIALSIVAGVLAAREGATGGWMDGSGP